MIACEVVIVFSLEGCHRISFTGLLTFHLVQILKEFVIINPDALASRHAESSPKFPIEISAETIQIFGICQTFRDDLKIVVVSQKRILLKGVFFGLRRN